MKTFNFKAGTEIFDEENGSYVIINGRHFSDWDVTIVSDELDDDGEVIGQERINTYLTSGELKRLAGADALNFIEEETDRNGVTREEFETAAKAYLDSWLAEHPDRVDRPKFDEEEAWIDEDYGGIWRWDVTARYGWNGEGFDHGAIVGTEKNSLALGMALCDDGGFISDFAYYD